MDSKPVFSPVTKATPLLAAVAACWVFALESAVAQSAAYDGAPLFYSSTSPTDPIARLRERLESGQLVLKHPDEKTFLIELLRELGVPVESQVLVFSKTSMQNSRISPQTPRTIYFSEEFYVGWVPGGMIEIGSIDPVLGAVFYLLDHRDRERELRFERPQDCLSCHASSRTGDIPGFLVRSVFPDATGLPILSEGSFLSGHDSPLEERWGGWYVTGQHGSQRHMGNVVAEVIDGEVRLDRERGANLDWLDHLFSTEPYLVPRSDILALMVLEHQVEMHNRLHQAAFGLRRALYLQRSVDEALGRKTPPGKLTGTALSVAGNHAEKILEHLLFCDEILLEDGGIDDSGEFRESFRANRRESKDGRSLKDFQLLDRIFKYRCSYMIYSSAFENLPHSLKQIVYRRLWTILNGRDLTGRFDHLSESERERIVEILAETKRDLPDYWRSPGT